MSQALSLQNQFHDQNVRFCALRAEGWGPHLQNHGPTKIQSKHVQNGWLLRACQPRFLILWQSRGAGWLSRIEGFWGANTLDSVEEIATKI